jgi:hypothetical protein
MIRDKAQGERAALDLVLDQLEPWRASHEEQPHILRAYDQALQGIRLLRIMIGERGRYGSNLTEKEAEGEYRSP